MHNFEEIWENCMNLLCWIVQLQEISILTCQLKNRAVLENRSLCAKSTCSFLCVLGRQNLFNFFICDFANFGGFHLLGIIDFNFSPILTQGLHFQFFDRRSRCIDGHHARTVISLVPQTPGCGAWMASTYASLIALEIPILSSTQTQPFLTWACFQ